MDNEFDTTIDNVDQSPGETPLEYNPTDQSPEYQSNLKWQEDQRKKYREYINQRGDTRQIQKADDLLAQEREYTQTDDDFRKQEKKRVAEWQSNYAISEKIRLAQQKAKETESFYSGNQYGNFFQRLSKVENRLYEFNPKYGIDQISLRRTR